MARRRPARQEMEQFEDTADAAQSDADVIEFDESRSQAESTGLAEIEDAPADAGATEVDPAMFQARDALEQRLGGLDAVIAAAATPAETAGVGLENIVGFGVGERTAGGRCTGELAVKVYVEEKLPLSQLTASATVPANLDGCPTDVEDVGEVHALRFTRRYRPAPGGSSIGHPKITAGTLGCLVVLNNNRLCILSNNHVAANSNSATVGDNCLQPGPADGGVNPRDRIGVLQSFVPINFSGGANRVDAATVWTSFALSSPKHHCYVINPRPINPTLNMVVRKCGRTTQHTLGLITGLGVSIRVRYGAKIALFRDQVQIRGFWTLFSQGGDSGSLVVSAGSRQPVALLFAGGGGSTFANPIGSVISEVGIRRFLSSTS